MKTRILTIIIALLSMAAGAQAAGTYTLEIYNGKQLNSFEVNALAAAVMSGGLTRTESGNSTFYKRDGETVFYFNNSNVVVIDTWMNALDINVKLNSTAQTLVPSYTSLLIRVEIALQSKYFPDANFLSYVKTFDTNSDNRLSMTEIEKVDRIICVGKNISNLTGIEHFTLAYNLNVLCYNNNLSTLDVSKISNLVSLHCYENLLKSLDVSKNNKLTILTCQNNLLTSLKVSTSARNLKEIQCYGNNLSGSSMDAFISSLPVVAGGTLYVQDVSLSKDNTMTSAQAEAVGEKGWVPMVKIGSNWQYYPGSDAIYINTNFPDGNFKSWVKSNCDKDGDGYLSTKEIAAVTEIDVRSKSITNLKGIEYFTALTILNCSNNQLTALDVSKNTSLRLIECYKNKLRGTAVDNLISSLPRKSGADLNFYNNETSTGNLMTYDQVQAAKQKGWTPRMMSTVDGSSAWAEYAGSDVVAIDATNFPDANFRKWLLEQSYGKDGYLTLAEIAGATFIDVSWKDIASLKGIEYFTALTELRCYENQLTSLNVSGCTALTVLRCFGNELMSLDVSGCTALTCLYCDNNELNSLDVSKNTALTDLDCTNNLLTSLDASKNTKLQTLQCSNNRLTSLILSKNATSLASINCDLNSLRGSSVDDFISSLPTTVLGIIAFCGNEAATGNRITIPQAKTARRKGWEVCQWNDALNNWVPYSGDILAGDANGDDEVNDEDLEAITDYLLGRTPSTFYSEGADMNGNGEVDIVDLTKLIKKLTE